MISGENTADLADQGTAHPHLAGRGQELAQRSAYVAQTCRGAEDNVIRVIETLDSGERYPGKLLLHVQGAYLRQYLAGAAPAPATCRTRSITVRCTLTRTPCYFRQRMVSLRFRNAVPPGCLQVDSGGKAAQLF